MESAEVGSKNLAIEDVRAALGDTDPHQTNSAKLRTIIGRGSNATIQKFLDVIRAERIAAQQPVEASAVPGMSEEFKSLWAPVYTAAVATVRARLDAVVSERDGLVLAVATGKQDLASLGEQLDTLEASFQSQADALKAAQETAIAEVQSAKDALQVQADLLAETRAALASAQNDVTKAQSDAANVAALAVRDAQIERQTMQMTIDRLTEQLSESKALHIARAMQPAAPAAAPGAQPTAKEKK